MATAPSPLPCCCVRTVSGFSPLVISFSGKIKKKKKKPAMACDSHFLPGVWLVTPATDAFLKDDACL